MSPAVGDSSRPARRRPPRAALLFLVPLLVAGIALPLAGCGSNSSGNQGAGGIFDRPVLDKIKRTVDPARESDTIDWLSSPELRGRPTGSPEGERAADHILEQFSSFGLQPVEQLNIRDLWQSFVVPGERLFIPNPPAGQVTCRNILGAIRGTEQPDNMVILTANYDGIGVDPDTGEVYPGADFNATGTAAVLELARVFTSLKLAPKKTVVFACFAAEESGSFGSRALADAIEQAGEKDQVQIINLQGLSAGPDEYLDLWDLNYRKNRPIAESVVSAAEFCGVNLERGGEDPGGSPASLFFVYHIAAVNCDWSWNARNDHPDFHLATDTPDKINIERVAESTQVVGTATWLLAGK